MASAAQGGPRRLVLMRGLPGSGKSSAAKKLGGTIISADDFFLVKSETTGVLEYVYDPNRAWMAHRWCQAAAKRLMVAGEPLVVVDNTNVDTSAMMPYAKIAAQYGYTVEFCVPETPWAFDVAELARRNIHGVTAETIDKQKQKYNRNITAQELLDKAKASIARAEAKQAKMRDEASARARASSGGGGGGGGGNPSPGPSSDAPAALSQHHRSDADAGGAATASPSKRQVHHVDDDDDANDDDVQLLLPERQREGDAAAPAVAAAAAAAAASGDAHTEQMDLERAIRESQLSPEEQEQRDLEAAIRLSLAASVGDAGATAAAAAEHGRFDADDDARDGGRASKRPRVEHRRSGGGSGGGSSSGGGGGSSSRNVPPTLFALCGVRRPSPRQEAADVGGERVPFCTTLGAILRLNMIQSSVQFNYKIDIQWLLEQYPEGARRCPLLLVHGERSKEIMEEQREELKAAGVDTSNIQLCPINLRDQWGVHHTKMAILFYKKHRGMRVVISTANLVAGDWDNRTNGVWVSPLFPRRREDVEKQDKNEEAAGTLGGDLLEYLEAYDVSPKSSSLVQIIRKAKAHVIGDIPGVRLVASVPGTHTGAALHRWGHLKMKALARQAMAGSVDADAGAGAGAAAAAAGGFVTASHLAAASAAAGGGTAKDVLIAQPSSISLADGKESLWWSTNLRLSMVGSGDAGCPLRLVWPSVEAVRTSNAGYTNGFSVPFDEKKYAKVGSWLRPLTNHWVAEWCGRTEFTPHIKTFCRYSAADRSLRWLLLTSHNVSKAAWGELQTNNSKLKIRHYELGVFFSGPVVPLGLARAGDDVRRCAPLPFDLPLSPYGRGDEMWRWDGDWTAPDRFGVRRVNGEWASLG